MPEAMPNSFRFIQGKTKWGERERKRQSYWGRDQIYITF